MNVLVIPENPRHDQYILKPLFERLFRSFGGQKTNVQICQDPVLGGVVAALKSERLAEVVEKHQGMTDVFILCVDRDGEPSRQNRLSQIEKEFGNGYSFLAVNAWEEIETWVLAGLKLPSGWRWAKIRSEIDVKERYFKPLAEQRAVADGPGGGRKALGEEAARQISAIRQKCSEDFNALALRLEAVSRLR